MSEDGQVQNEFNFALETRRRDMILIPERSTKMRPAQVAFNNRVKKLRKLQAQLNHAQSRIDQLKNEFIEDVVPEIMAYNRVQIKWIHTAIESYQGAQSVLSSMHAIKFRLIIFDEYDKLLQHQYGIDAEEFEQLEAKIDEIRDNEEDDDDIDDDDPDEMEMYLMKMMADMLRSQGVEVDLSDLDNDDIEGMQERINKAMSEAGSPAAKPRKRSTKQIAAAEERARKEREREQIKLRNFKSLFKSLAKAMHPDLVTDDQAKEHREKWMKRLTAAYESQDLHTMLTIEMEWLGSEGQDLEKASDEKLNNYSMLIREQIFEVEKQIQEIQSQNPFNSYYLNPIAGEPRASNLCPLIKADTESTKDEIELLKTRGKKFKRYISSLIRRNGY